MFRARRSLIFDIIGVVQDHSPEIEHRPQMMECSCGRQTPADRVACIYCGSELVRPAGSTTPLKINFQEFETWEKGVVTVAVGCSNEVDIEQAAAVIPLSADELDRLCRCGFPIPISRLRTSAEAEAVADRLAAANIRCIAIDEARLLPEIEPVRLRKIEIGTDGPVFVTFNTNENICVAWSDITHVVYGTIFTSQLDSLEKRVRGGKRKAIDGTAMTNDEDVLDIYITGHREGFRILPAGMDFSFLAGEMSLLAADNMRRTLDLLSDRSTNARTNLSYREIRGLLGHTWPATRSKDSKGTSGGMISGRRFSSSLTTSNAAQFLRFSRLQSLDL